MYCALLSLLSMTITSRVLVFLVSSTSARISTCMAVEKIRTLARKLSTAASMRSVFSHCATMRKSSSTASTLAAPARKMAWLSARMILSMCYAADARRPRSRTFAEVKLGNAYNVRLRQECLLQLKLLCLRVPNKLVVVNNASHAVGVSIAFRPLSTHHAALALNAHIMIAADNLGRQGNLELDV